VSTIWCLNAPAADRCFSAASVKGLLDVASAPSSAKRLLRAIETLVPVAFLFSLLHPSPQGSVQTISPNSSACDGRKRGAEGSCLIDN
jgi:hypothetical protein